MQKKQSQILKKGSKKTEAINKKVKSTVKKKEKEEVPLPKPDTGETLQF